MRMPIPMPEFAHREHVLAPQELGLPMASPHNGMKKDACRLLNLPLRPLMTALASTQGRLELVGLCQAGSSSLLRCHECHCLPFSTASCSASGATDLRIVGRSSEDLDASKPRHLQSNIGPALQCFTCHQDHLPEPAVAASWHCSGALSPFDLLFTVVLQA